MDFDLEMTDALLSTTRSVRKRLDTERPVPRSIIEECIGLSQQAPTGTNSQGWRWIIVEDKAKRERLAEIYRMAAGGYLAGQEEMAKESGDQQTTRVIDSASFLADNLQNMPVHVIPCLEGKPPEGTPIMGITAMMASIFPAVWSFQLALRARGLGSCITSLHLMNAHLSAELLGIPDDIMQVALLPVGFTKGTDFKTAKRPPPSSIIHYDQW
ncbi:MAG: nitroreductase family protein [Pseudomonadales bacterium]|jgi:nitroreductase|tara:strand:- start:4050 stop:4688 length:639 start_codon:yes stop_codon:yes gene_type:complete